MIRAACLWLALAGGASADCRQALALGLDVSGSVDAREYRLQVEGLAGALASDDVRDALLANPGAPVRIAVFEWSGPAAQRLILPWTEIASDADVTAAVARIAGTRRVQAEPTTAIGAAMHHGGRLLAEQAGCWQLTLDLSGDGKSNVGIRPQDVSQTDLPPGMTINGLVIGAEPDEAAARRLVEVGELQAYYQAYVIRGPQAFTEVALGFEDYEAAMRRKLLRELQSLAIGKRRPN